MPHTANFTEILRQTPEDLTREAREQQLQLAKTGLQVKLGSHKDTAGYRRAKRQLARLHTALSMKKNDVKTGAEKPVKKVLKKTAKASTLSVPASA